MQSPLKFIRSVNRDIMMLDNPFHVFVYGSLRRGQGLNNALLRNFEPLRVSKTVEKFCMIDLGAFPGVIQNPKKIEITGEVYKVPRHIMTQLDRAEGHPRFYKREEIHVTDFYPEVWMYMLPEAYYNKNEEVSSGDWLQHLAERTENRKRLVSAV